MEQKASKACICGPTQIRIKKLEKTVKNIAGCLIKMKINQTESCKHINGVKEKVTELKHFALDPAFQEMQKELSAIRHIVGNYASIMDRFNEMEEYVEFLQVVVEKLVNNNKDTSANKKIRGSKSLDSGLDGLPK